MASVELRGVSLSYPIFDAKSRSLAKKMISAGTGGRLLSGGGGHVRVQALEDINLHFRHGDRVALVGHNGAGKSTLLRVLAGVYEPFVGSVIIEGRTVPLFDVSLGMNGDSTGYENIRLRGMFLGLTPAEIRERTPEIAEFAELGSFLQVPFKTYSSGMMARLAFAISTSVHPDVLLLDEGIGAGDAAFVEKANQRLEEFVDRAGILVLASHNESLLRRWCNRAVLMKHGKMEAEGTVDEILERYAGGL